MAHVPRRVKVLDHKGHEGQEGRQLQHYPASPVPSRARLASESPQQSSLASFAANRSSVSFASFVSFVVDALELGLAGAGRCTSLIASWKSSTPWKLRYTDANRIYATWSRR